MVLTRMFRYLFPDGRGWNRACLGCVGSEDMFTAFRRHHLLFMSCMGGIEAALTCCAVLPTLCRASRSAAVVLPYHTVMQLVRMLSTVDLQKLQRRCCSTRKKINTFILGFTQSPTICNTKEKKTKEHGRLILHKLIM